MWYASILASFDKCEVVEAPKGSVQFELSPFSVQYEVCSIDQALECAIQTTT